MVNYKFPKEALNWLEQLLIDRLGVKLQLNYIDACLVLTVDGTSIVFDQLNKKFVFGGEISFTKWDCSAEGFLGLISDELPTPGLIEEGGGVFQFENQMCIVSYDLMGLIYWALNRVEELEKNELDKHQRFKASSSHAVKHGYLERPFIDEWLDILGQVVIRLNPNLSLKKHKAQMFLSHDVDQPAQYAFNSWATALRMASSYLLRQKSIKKACRPIWQKLISYKEISLDDPYNTFDLLMDLSEKKGIKSSFYFIAGGNNKNYDASYRLTDRRIHKLLLEIDRRGHEIGLHSSYEMFNLDGGISKEMKSLKAVCSALGIKQSYWGGRMHYLRWSHPKTLFECESAGMSYDTTLGYAELPGFRCGTCFEYLAFDPIEKKRLNIRIRPLIVMESTIIEEEYLGLGKGKEARRKILHLKRICNKVNGNFSLLWHNSSLTTVELKKMYMDIVNDNNIS